MFIPAEREKINPETLNSLFEATGTDLPEVTSVEVTELDSGYGYLSTVFQLSLQWRGVGANDAPTTLIAKLPLQDRLDAMTPDAVRMFRREAMFHRLIAPEVGLRTAKAWVTEIDEESGAATLVYEDLGWMETFDDDDNISVERIERALVELAQLHAKYWNSSELGEFDWLARPKLTGVDQVSADRFTRFWPELVASGAYELSPAQIRLGELLSEKLDSVYEAVHAGPEALTHSDLHQENIFFDGDNPAFIDWALAERANPAKDVAKLTSSCLKPGTVSKQQPQLIRAYLAALSTYGIDVSFSEFERYIYLATCGYLASLTFLSDDPDFAGLAASPETRTDFTKSRVIAACDRDEIVSVVEAL